jgi:hypothetical protein
MFPIGAIVASLMTYEEFLKANNHSRKDTWLPCDGRILPRNSAYSKATGKSHAPDLRGLFLRGANEMEKERGEKGLDPHYRNIEQKQVGEKQEEMVGKHHHQLVSAWPPNTVLTNTVLKDALAVAGHNSKPQHSGDKPNDHDHGNHVVENTGKETRPKNMTVNYFVKVD